MILFYGPGEHAYLSNFHYAPFEADGLMWPTVEHYFQAMKTLSLYDRKVVSRLETPGEAKRAGRSLQLRSDWENVKVDVMRDALRHKFTQHPDLAEKLLATGDEVLHEDSPTDKIWGWRDNGLDLLGKCLMEVRKELQEKGAGKAV